MYHTRRWTLTQSIWPEYIHTSLYAHIHKRTQKCVCAYERIYIHVLTHACMHVQTFTGIHRCKQALARTMVRANRANLEEFGIVASLSDPIF